MKASFSCILLFLIVYKKMHTQFGVAPWNADGSINPLGVGYGRVCDMFCPKDRQIQDEKCEAQKTEAPVQFKSIAEKRRAAAAVNCAKLDRLWGTSAKAV